MKDLWYPNVKQSPLQGMNGMWGGVGSNLIGGGGSAYLGNENQPLGGTLCKFFLPNNSETDSITGTDKISEQFTSGGSPGAVDDMTGYSVSNSSNNAYRITTYFQSETSPWSCSFWHKRGDSSGLATNNRLIDFREHTPSHGSTIVWESNSTWNFVLRCNNTSTGTKLIASGGNMNDNAWHFVTVTVAATGADQTSLTYFDGSAVGQSGQGNRSDSYEGTGMKLFSGFGGTSGGTGTKQVFMANFRMWEHALSATQVSDLYDIERGA